MSCAIEAPRLVVDARLVLPRGDGCPSHVRDNSLGLFPRSPVRHDFTFLDPYRTIACEETISAILSSNSGPSLFRTNDLVTNQAFYGRKFLFEADTPGSYYITVSSAFQNFITVYRRGGVYWQGSDRVDFVITAENSGPLIVEVTSTARRIEGAFSITAHCPTTTVGSLLSLYYPGTLNVPYFSSYGPRISPTASSNRVLSDVTLTYDDADNPAHDPLTVLYPGAPDGLVITDEGWSAPYHTFKISGTPTLAGTFLFTIQVKLAGVLIAQRDMHILIGQKPVIPLFDGRSWFQNYWNHVYGATYPAGSSTGILLYSFEDYLGVYDYAEDARAGFPTGNVPTVDSFFARTSVYAPDSFLVDFPSGLDAFDVFLTGDWEGSGEKTIKIVITDPSLGITMRVIWTKSTGTINGDYLLTLSTIPGWLTSLTPPTTIKVSF